MKRLRVAALISGRGSNMAALVDAAINPNYPAEIALVLSNKEDAGGLQRACSAGIKTIVVPHRNFIDRETFERAVHSKLCEYEIDFICLTGFMRILTPWFIERWSGRIINIHPSLLPSFRGLHTHEQAIEAGVKIHGCTVHYVVPDLDAGPIIAQAAVPVFPNDTVDALAERVLEAELVLYPHALSLIATSENSTTLHVENGPRVLYSPLILS